MRLKSCVLLTSGLIMMSLGLLVSLNTSLAADPQEFLPAGTLNAEQLVELFSGKTVESVTAVRERVSLTYYAPNGNLLQSRKGLTRTGRWRVTDDARICLQMEDLPEKCRIIVNESGIYKKYIVKKSGQHQHSVTYRSFREGNLLE